MALPKRVAAFTHQITLLFFHISFITVCQSPAGLRPRGRPRHNPGDDLAGTTSVTFNGTPAAYRVVSKSEIGATIPAGAASGRIAVVAPKGIAPFALLSNVPFHVTEF
jgi:hypothetical protein